MIYMIIDVCIIDGWPIEHSPAYLLAERLYGKEGAAQFVREEVIPPVELTLEQPG